MSGRNIVLATNEYYHIFNRGIARQPIFFSKRDYERLLLTFSYYRLIDHPVKLSRFLSLPSDTQNQILTGLNKKQHTCVDIVCYVLMPNHFHLILKQNFEGGITEFMSKSINSYTRYVNVKQERVGDLFQGVFKAVRIETNEQLLHVSRYIHINPVVSHVIKDEDLFTYPWSSLPDYIHKTTSFVSNSVVIDQFSDRELYKNFVLDHMDYGKKLEEIKHLLVEK